MVVAGRHGLHRSAACRESGSTSLTAAAARVRRCRPGRDRRARDRLGSHPGVGRGALRPRLRHGRRVRARRRRPHRRRLHRAVRRHAAARLHERAAVHERRHRNPRIRDAIVEALDRYGFVWEVRDRLPRPRGEARSSTTCSARRLGRAHPVHSSGSEAVELALLVAKLVTGRPNVISRDFAYHGWTHGALSLMGLPGSRGILAAPDSDEMRRPAGDPDGGRALRPRALLLLCPIGHTYPACKRGGETLACIDALEHLIRTLGPDSIAGRGRRADLRRGHVPPAGGVPAPAPRAHARARHPLDRRRGDDRASAAPAEASPTSTARASRRT